MDSDALTLLLDERAIERALILFARAMDERDWSTMAAILTHDAFGDFGTGPLAGSAAIIELIRSYLDNCGPTQHLLGNVIVEVDGDTATSLAYVRDIHLNSTADPAVRFYTLGDYHDTWRRTRDGSWRMSQRIKANRGYVGPLEIFGN
ncbi:ethyl tert-butyl ether degradation protein EthD [Mycolicibacterium aromaticivorans JS19b1 = JCM 16368]|uniref:Ethyl tert-butyl ether degradation protein EthD n=1 Tax=Mycolicibacterium aromaticivorans JS19b1 = JCM 16368 TaxID=1440774 RepID=A0A064CRY6_9MYCO|nr:nuclear transport factor 2 family protein [Mycolicibacterium aromaticivorans]KDF02427.1 ethyl tert-butyl ether degradation protein EthD [Mycolicibacterium aromaticivorans JS19b1 = JCM 16368]